MAVAGWAAAPATTVAAKKPAGINVLETQGDQAGQVLTTFRSLACKVNRTGFHGTDIAGGWTLRVRIRKFNGFHRYPLRYGLPARASFDLLPPGGAPSFSNIWTPDQIPLPDVGGGLAFPGSHRPLYLGFPSAFNSVELPDTRRVAVVGTAACGYPGRGP